MGHLYTIYMQDKLIHDRQPGRSRGTLQAGERRAWLCLKLPFAAKLQGVLELDWGPDAFVCCPFGTAPMGKWHLGVYLLLLETCCHLTAARGGILDEMDTSAFGL